jgi:hypothetical protein
MDPPEKDLAYYYGQAEQKNVSLYTWQTASKFNPGQSLGVNLYLLKGREGLTFQSF